MINTTHQAPRLPAVGTCAVCTATPPAVQDTMQYRAQEPDCPDLQTPCYPTLPAQPAAGPIHSGPCFPTIPDQPGEPTTNPSVGAKFADKLTRAFGEAALLGLDDSRLLAVAGYVIGGLESPVSDDWVSGVTLGRLGEKWEMPEYGRYELTGKGISQTLSFDLAQGLTRLESRYEETLYDTTTSREILTLDRDGQMRREVPPPGL